MLKKVKQVAYSIASGQVQFNDEIKFNEGDHNVSYIQLRGELDKAIKAQLKVQPPKGEAQLVDGKEVPYNNISREFLVPTDLGVGKYKVQIILNYSYQTNVSDIFNYEVVASI